MTTAPVISFAPSLLAIGRTDPAVMVRDLDTDFLLDIALGQQLYAEHFAGTASERAVRDELLRRGVSATWGEA